LTPLAAVAVSTRDAASELQVGREVAGNLWRLFVMVQSPTSRMISA
jgi:hypothetical protein